MNQFDYATEADRQAAESFTRQFVDTTRLEARDALIDIRAALIAENGDSDLQRIAKALALCNEGLK